MPIDADGDYVIEGALTEAHLAQGPGGSAWGCPVNLAIRDALRQDPIPRIDPDVDRAVEVGYYVALLHALGERGLFDGTVYGALLPPELHGYPLRLERGQPCKPVEFMLVFIRMEMRQP